MKRIILVSTVALMLTACGDSVPAVADPHNVVVDGKPMTQQAFLLKYCAGKLDNETCVKVQQAMAQDMGTNKAGAARF